VFLHREDGDQHSLLIKGALFDDIENIESTYSFFCVSDSEEKPIIVAISVKVVLDY
jgi:hypothetical protein